MLGVSCLLTLSVNKCDVILNNALFFFDHLGSIEAVKMSRSTSCLIYWSQFINHEISTIPGIRWYIANVLMHCGFVSSVHQVVNSNHSEFLTSYVDNKAICIYQTCYHDTRYKVMSLTYRICCNYLPSPVMVPEGRILVLFLLLFFSW